MEACDFTLFKRALRLGNLPLAIRLIPLEPSERLAFLKMLTSLISESIGPANPCLFMDLEDMIAKELKAESNNDLIKIVEIMCKSRKSSLFAFVSKAMEIEFEFYREEFDDPFLQLRKELSNLSQYLEDFNFESSVRTAYKIRYLQDKYPDLVITGKQWIQLKKDNSCPKISKHFACIHHQFWMPVLGHLVKFCESQKTANLVSHIYYSTCVRLGRLSLRGEMPNPVYWIHAIWAICNSEDVESSWKDRIPPDPPFEEIYEQPGPCGNSLNDFLFIELRVKKNVQKLVPEESKWLDKCLDKQ